MSETDGFVWKQETGWNQKSGSTGNQGYLSDQEDVFGESSRVKGIKRESSEGIDDLRAPVLDKRVKGVFVSKRLKGFFEQAEPSVINIINEIGELASIENLRQNSTMEIYRSQEKHAIVQATVNLGKDFLQYRKDWENDIVKKFKQTDLEMLKENQKQAGKMEQWRISMEKASENIEEKS